jgi:hypothetical protein
MAPRPLIAPTKIARRRPVIPAEFFRRVFRRAKLALLNSRDAASSRRKPTTSNLGETPKEQAFSVHSRDNQGWMD